MMERHHFSLKEKYPSVVIEVLAGVFVGPYKISLYAFSIISYVFYVNKRACLTIWTFMS